MPTYNYTRGGAGFPARFAGRSAVVERYFDMAEIAAQRSAAGLAAIGAADVLEAIDVPANTFVLAAGINVLKAEGAAATADLGDGAGAANYLSNVDLNVVAASASLVVTAYSVAVGGGKYYAAADTIDVVIDSASVDVAQFLVWAVMFECARTEVYGKA